HTLRSGIHFHFNREVNPVTAIFNGYGTLEYPGEQSNVRMCVFIFNNTTCFCFRESENYLRPVLVDLFIEYSLLIYFGGYDIAGSIEIIYLRFQFFNLFIITETMIADLDIRPVTSFIGEDLDPHMVFKFDINSAGYIAIKLGGIEQDHCFCFFIKITFFQFKVSLFHFAKVSDVFIPLSMQEMGE